MSLRDNIQRYLWPLSEAEFKQDACGARERAQSEGCLLLLQKTLALACGSEPSVTRQN